MPYVDNQDDKEALQFPENAGELTYVLFDTVLRYIRRRGIRYQQLGDVVLALEQTKDEFQRQIIHPYEDKKRAQNPIPLLDKLQEEIEWLNR